MDSIAADYGTGGGDAKTSENEWPHQMGWQIPAQAVAVIERFKARVIPEMLSIGLALSNILSEPAGRSLIQRTVHMPRIASHFIDKQQFTTPACCLLLSLAILLRLIQRFGNRRRRQSPSGSWTEELAVSISRPQHLKSSCLIALVKEGEGDDKICTVRSAAGKAGQGKGGRGFFAFRSTLGER